MGVWSQDLTNLKWPVGVGCVNASHDGIWFADHLLYAAQDDLENGPDARFFGYLRDPVFTSMTPNGQGWGYVVERWYKSISKGHQRSGWLTSPRWLLPLPCHFIPSAEKSDPLVASLFQRAAEVSALAATVIHDEPRIWWRDDGLRPRQDHFAEWVASDHRPGYGVMSKNAIARRGLAA